MSGLPASYLPPRRYRGPYRLRRPAGGAEKAAGIALAAVLVSGLGAKAAVTVTHHHHAAAPRPAVVPAAASGTLDCSQLEALWEAAGGNPAAAFLAAEIAMAESSGRQDPPSNADINSNGMTDVGYWQINSGYWPNLATTDPYGNARAAVIISGNGTNWTPWVTYDLGKYIGKC
jgi:hypothetical protein